MRHLPAFLAIMFCLAQPPAAGSSGWMPDRAALGYGNDLFTNGIGVNADDQWSYGVSAEVEAPAWSLSFTGGAITNRGWKESWFGDGGGDDYTSGRLDVVKTLFSLKVPAFSPSFLRIDFRPQVGFNLFGDLGFAAIQNFAHDLWGLAPVELEYSTSGVDFSPTLGGELSIGAAIPAWGTEFLFALGASAEWSPGYESVMTAGGSVSLGDFFSVSLSHYWPRPLSGDSSHAVLMWHLEGWVLSTRVKAGALEVRSDSDLESGFGYGEVLVDVMAFTRGPEDFEPDLRYWLLWDRRLGRNFYRNQVTSPIGDTGFNVVVANGAISGPRTEGSGAEGEREKIVYSSLRGGVGYERELPFTEGWLTVYCDVAIGAEVFRDLAFNTGDPTADSPRDEERMWSFLVDAECGLVIFPEGLLRAGGAEYQLVVGAGLTWYAGDVSEVNTGLSESLPQAWAGGKLVPRILLGLRAGLDL